MQKGSKFWNVKHNASDENAVDVLIYGIIGYDWWSGEGTLASAFVREFKELEKQYDRINVRINSPGGSIHEGLPIINIIAQSKKDVHTYCDGIAYSMAAIILFSGKHVHAAKNSLILIHSAITSCYGNAKDMRDMADILDKYNGTLITTVATKTGLTEDEVAVKYFDHADHLFSAQEALESNLVDEIVEEEGKIPEGISDMNYNDVMALFKNGSQDGFISKLANHMKQFFNISPKTETDIIMTNLDKFIAAFKLDANASIDDVFAAIEAQNQKITEMEAANATIQASLTEKTEALVVAESQLAAEVSAHAVTKQEFEAFKALDAGDATGAPKDLDEIEHVEDPSASFKHNQFADSFVKK